MPELHVGVPPQSEEEVAPIREALRTRLSDPLLDFRWNARCFRVPTGYDALGNPLNERWEGRWEVIRFETDHVRIDRPFAVICTVCEIDQPNSVRRYPIMLDRGPYAPLTWAIVDYMQLWDRARSRHAEEAMKQAWAEHELAESPDDNRAANQEGAETVYRKAAGEYWMGGAQGRAHPETAKTLWEKVKDDVKTIVRSITPDRRVSHP